MESFRTEIENQVVAQDILELDKMIFKFNNQQIDEKKFRSLRLARGVYGQRQQGVQMIRIKIPYGKISAPQLRRIAVVSDEYSNGNLHITTRQDIQIHYVALDRTPALWEELEKDAITLREACGNTVRNVTASIFAGIDTEEPFDVSPYAQAFFEYFLRNPICQDMGRKFKVSFSSSDKDTAMGFVHDLGFIPKIENKVHGFLVLLGGGIGSQPREADILERFLPSSELIPFSESVIRVFDRFGERNKRQKARMKFLVKELGLEKFLSLVSQQQKALPHQSFPIEYQEEIISETAIFETPLGLDSNFDIWKKGNVFEQKQSGLVSVGIPVQTGDFSSEQARKLADIIEGFCGEPARLSVGQSILLRSIKSENLGALYQALKSIGLSRIGFHKINDIVACPGTDTCNLGIASSMGLADELQRILEQDYPGLLLTTSIDIKISGCMNACGQHTIANIGFQGMTVNAGKLVAPATQILLGGGILGNGQGRFADKLLKVPSRRTPIVLRWLLDDYLENKLEEEAFNSYYDRQGKDYFYQNLKHLAETENLHAQDLIDWGNEKKYEKAIGIGECAGVTIDLVQTLLFDAQESLEAAESSAQKAKWSDSIYHSYAAQIRAAKAILTTVNAKINTQKSILEAFDIHFPNFSQLRSEGFEKTVLQMDKESPSEDFSLAYLKQAVEHIQWIKNFRDEQA